MKTYHIGRFAVDVPEDLKLAVQSQKIRYAEISDFRWKDPRKAEKERDELWRNKVSEIKALTAPVDKSAILIEEKSFQGIGKWAKGLRYRGDYLLPERQFWMVIVDYGDVGVLLKIAGTNNALMLNNLTNILRSYNYGVQPKGEPAFYLREGRLLLPYLEQERTYVRFERIGASEHLEIKMTETHEVEEAGLIKRLVAAIATNFAPGVDVDRIRTKKRVLASLKGEEVITRLTDENGPELYFGWEYKGKVDSGNHPEIQIALETKNENLDQKIMLWDLVLETFRPAN